MESTKEDKIKRILEQQVKLASPSKEDFYYIEEKTKELIEILNKNIKKSKISAEVFVGGSSAKGTLVKKKEYDIDIFVRFDSKRYKDEEISGLLLKIVPKDAKRIHGSRDYFSLKIENIKFEIIPVLKISKPEEAKNVTDLSYFHVNYVKNKLGRNPRLADEIKLAKVFVHSQNCYGAESYINGFSGYALELLILHYKTFLKFIRAIAKANIRKKKIILDPEKCFRGEEEIKRELNEAKLQSPIVLVDPTYKERNALAALSLDTFLKFQASCKRFLKSPSIDFFKIKDIEKDFYEKHGKNVIKLELSTEKQTGDIAGTKLKKFYNYFLSELQRYFKVIDSDFIYDENQNYGKILLVIEKREELIYKGPPVSMKESLIKFRKKHKRIEIKKGVAYAIEKNNLVNFENFLEKFENEKSKIMEEMGVQKIKKI